MNFQPHKPPRSTSMAAAWGRPRWSSFGCSTTSSSAGSMRLPLPGTLEGCSDYCCILSGWIIWWPCHVSIESPAFAGKMLFIHWRCDACVDALSALLKLSDSEVWWQGWADWVSILTRNSSQVSLWNHVNVPVTVMALAQASRLLSAAAQHFHWRRGMATYYFSSGFSCTMSSFCNPRSAYC